MNPRLVKPTTEFGRHPGDCLRTGHNAGVNLPQRGAPTLPQPLPEREGSWRSRAGANRSEDGA